MNRPTLQLLINKPFPIQVKAEGTEDPISKKPYFVLETRAEFQRRVLAQVHEQIKAYWPKAAAFNAMIISPAERPALERGARWLNLYQGGQSAERIRRKHAPAYSARFIEREIRRVAKRYSEPLRASRTRPKH
jgi:hypothetical protein